MRYYQQQGPVNGRSVGFGPRSVSPFIKWMLIINVGVLVFQYLIPGLTWSLGLTPRRFFNEFPNLFYQIFTYMFLHSPSHFTHIMFNMFALWMFGTEIEYLWGSKSFAKFYFLCGIAGAVATLIAYPSQSVPMIGASAAIYGVLVAYWVMFPHRMLYIYFLFPIKVKWAIPGMMLLGFLFSGGNVAHVAHLGGALFGLAYLKLDWRALALAKKFKSLKRQHQEDKLQKRRAEAEDVMKRIDAILDKINDVGIENLTRSERKFLEEASSELSGEKDKTGKGR